MGIVGQSSVVGRHNVGLSSVAAGTRRRSVSNTQVATTLILPEIVAAAAVAGAVAEICKAIKSIFSSAEGPVEVGAIFQKAEAQINATINQFKSLIATCMTGEELAAVERQIEELLGSVANPAVCQRFALVLREALCRAEQQLARKMAEAKKRVHDATVSGLKDQLQQNQRAHTEALAREDGVAAKRLEDVIARGQAQMGAICQEFDRANTSARAAIEAIRVRGEALGREREDLEELSGLSGMLKVDEFNRRASSTSRMGTRRSNGSSVLSKPKVGGVGPRI